MLHAAEQAALLKLARQTLEHHFSGTTPAACEFQQSPLTELAGAFVTLRAHGKLRGCIGFIRSTDPLWKTVQDAVVRAAVSDDRFEPVTATELPDLRIEVSVLSSLTRSRPEELQIGTHGVHLRRGTQSGLLLPQVAVEWKWDREAFLNAACEKAHLPANAWKEAETEISLFTAEVFGEP